MFPNASISGQADHGRYCQTLVTGNFFVVVLLSGLSTDVDMEAGRNILEKIEEVVGQSPEITPAELVEHQGKQKTHDGDISLIAGKVETQKLSVSSVGKMGAKILRQGKVINLLDEGLEIKTVSGPLQHNDLIIFGTGAFLSDITQNDLTTWRPAEMETISELMTARVEGSEHKEEMGGIFVRIDLSQKNTEPINSQEKVGEMQMGTREKVEMQVPKPGSQLAAIFSGNKKWLPTILNNDAPSRKTLYLIAIVFIILVCLIVFQLRSRNLETSSKNYQLIESFSNQGLDSATKLIGLNDQIARDSLLQTRKDTVSQIENAFGTDWQKKDIPEKEKLLTLLKKIDEQIGRVSHVYSVSDLPVYYDFALLKSNPKISSANLHSGQIVALDVGNGAVYSLTSSNKQATLVIGNGDLKNGKYVDFSGDSAFVFANNGISQIKLGGSSSAKQIVKSSEKWGEIKALTFFGGNLYLLDSQNNQIWKYQGTDLGFADLVNYIKTGLPVDISRGTSMNVDGFVYVLTASGQIARFSGGDFSDFKITGAPEEFSSIRSFYVSDETQNVYFWDESGKILVVDKKGVYQAEYKISNGNPPAGGQIANPIILADEKVKKIFLVTGSKVYGVEMK